MTRLAVVAVILLGLALLPLVFMGFVLLGVTKGNGCGEESPQLADQAWSAEQMTNARTITETTAARVLPPRAAVIAIATAIVESHLINLGYGDRDSLGLFQQRPSMGWGTPSQVTNPVYATNVFLDRLVQVPRWSEVSLGSAAQAVQRSAFPDRYQSWEHQAQTLVDRYWTGRDKPAQMTGGCHSTPSPPKPPPSYTPPPDPLQHAAGTAS